MMNGLAGFACQFLTQVLAKSKSKFAFEEHLFWVYTDWLSSTYLYYKKKTSEFYIQNDALYLRLQILVYIYSLI